MRQATRQNVIRAGVFASSGFVLGNVLRLGGNVVLTHLLVPEMFALMSVASIVIILVSQLSDVGIRQYIIRSEDGDTEEVLNTAWTIQVVRGIILSLLVMLMAVLVAEANQRGYTPPDTTISHFMLPIVLLSMSIIPVLQGLQSTKRFVINRKLFLGRLMVIGLLSHAIGLTVMIVWGLYEQTIWVLIVGTIFQTLLSVIFSHILLPGTPNRFYWNHQKAREIYSFSKWIFVSSAFGVFINYADSLWFSFLVPPAVLGVYTVAKVFSTVGVSFIKKISTDVLLPALSDVARDDPRKLSNAYYKARLPIDVFAFVLCGGLFTVSNTIIELLYDERYHSAGNMLAILSLSLLTIGPMQSERFLVVLKQVKAKSLATAVYAISLNMMIPVFFHYHGLDGVLYVLVAAPLIAIVLQYYYLHRTRVLNLFKEVRLVPLFLVGIFLGHLFNLAVSYVKS